MHAFPVVNSRKDRLFPALVDMGKHLRVGETYAQVSALTLTLQTIDLESNCPVAFEYEIDVLKPHPDIQIGKPAEN